MRNEADLGSFTITLLTLRGNCKFSWFLLYFDYLASDHFVPISINTVRILSVYEKVHSLDDFSI